MLDTNFPLYVGVFLTTLICTLLLERALIPRLRLRAKQPIYEGGPKWHGAKFGTPTLGGLGFLPSVVIPLLGACLFLLPSGHREEAISLVCCLAYALSNSFIGIFDDLVKLKRRENAGLAPLQKLGLQTVAALLFLLSRAVLLGENGRISFSFGEVNLGFAYFPISLILLLGITNCANLTDGIDGLASSVAFGIGICLFYVSCALCYDVCFISSSLLGATVGFLFFNIHPARIFMGDTGSLFLGALICSSVFALGNPLLVIFIGGVYVLEGLSVIIQVAAFKLTGRRVFRMAPLHHHLEKIGFSENKICLISILASFIFSIPAFALYLP